MLIPLTEWMNKYGVKKRDAYRLAEDGKINPVKQLREVVQKRKMWVLCVDEDCQP
jgi:hypothetical protein